MLISKTVSEQLANVPSDVVRDQLRFRQHGIITIWSEKLLGHTFVDRYHKMVHLDRSHIDFVDLDGNELASAVPQRTHLAVELSADGSVILSGLWS